MPLLKQHDIAETRATSTRVGHQLRGRATPQRTAAAPRRAM